MKPIIGILAETDNEQVTKLQPTYTRALEKSGGIPIILPYIKEEVTLDSYIDICDGFLFTGGADIDPMHYGEGKRASCGIIEPYRDEFELKFFKKAISSKKPILAICRGAQLVNVALGGTLYQDIPSEVQTEILHRQNEPQSATFHSVKLVQDAPLFDLIGTAEMTVNSIHHQAIKRLADGLTVMATADDGIIEAVCLSAEQYLRAFQWHPERLYDDDALNHKIFDDFIRACRKF